MKELVHFIQTIKNKEISEKALQEEYNRKESTFEIREFHTCSSNINENERKALPEAEL